MNDPGVTTLFLTVGLPGAGKTTRARQLAKEHSALRLTPDEWMIPLVYLPVDQETQRARIAHRQSTAPDQTFPMTEADPLHWRTLFEEPNDTELDGREIGGPPPGWPGWLEWAADRWPSFT